VTSDSTIALDPDAPSVYLDTEANVWVYRASALGGCIRALVYGRKGVEGHAPPEWLQERFDEGHYHEAAILAQFEEDQGYNLFGNQDVVEIKVKPPTKNGPGVVVRGHIDARTYMATGLCVVDAKAVTEATYKMLVKGVGQMPEYDWQQSVYCAGLEAETYCLAIGIKDRDKPLADQLVEFHYIWGTPTYTISDIRKRVLEIERIVREGGEGDCNGMYPCPFFHLHDGDEKRGGGEEWVEVTGKDAAAVTQAHELYTQRKDLEARVKDLKAQEARLVDRLVEAHGVRVQAGGVKLTRTADVDVPEQTKTTKAHTRRGYPKYTTESNEESE